MARKTPKDAWRVEAGRVAGRYLLTNYGPEWFAALAQKAGMKVREERGLEHFRNAGQIGGTRTAATHDHEWHRIQGAKGGEAVKTKYGPDYYSEIGKKGAAARNRRRLEMVGLAIEQESDLPPSQFELATGRLNEEDE